MPTIDWIGQLFLVSAAVPITPLFFLGVGMGVLA
jgi:hypothetical protein